MTHPTPAAQDGEPILTWQDRIVANYGDGLSDRAKKDVGWSFLLAEIADLRAALSNRAAEPEFGPIGFGLTDRQVLLETADLLMERNWRGDLAETLRDMASQPAPSDAAAEQAKLTDADINGLYHASQGQPLREQDAGRVRKMARAVEMFLAASGSEQQAPDIAPRYGMSAKIDGYAGAKFGDGSAQQSPSPDWRTLYEEALAKLLICQDKLTEARVMGSAQQASKPTDLSKRLREYAGNPGYSHGDYADTMRAGADEIERYYGAMLAWKRTAEAKDLATQAATVTGEVVGASEDALDAARFRQAIALEDNADTLHAAVLNNAPDGVAIRSEFDGAIKAMAPVGPSGKGGA